MYFIYFSLIFTGIIYTNGDAYITKCIIWDSTTWTLKEKKIVWWGGAVGGGGRGEAETSKAKSMEQKQNVALVDPAIRL